MGLLCNNCFYGCVLGGSSAGDPQHLPLYPHHTALAGARLVKSILFGETGTTNQVSHILSGTSLSAPSDLANGVIFYSTSYSDLLHGSFLCVTFTFSSLDGEDFKSAIDSLRPFVIRIHRGRPTIVVLLQNASTTTYYAVHAHWGCGCSGHILYVHISEPS